MHEGLTSSEYAESSHDDIIRMVERIGGVKTKTLNLVKRNFRLGFLSIGTE